MCVASPCGFVRQLPTNTGKPAQRPQPAAEREPPPTVPTRDMSMCVMRPHATHHTFAAPPSWRSSPLTLVSRFEEHAASMSSASVRQFRRGGTFSYRFSFHSGPLPSLSEFALRCPSIICSSYLGNVRHSSIDWRVEGRSVLYA